MSRAHMKSNPAAAPAPSFHQPPHPFSIDPPKNGSHREEETLAKLSSFSSGLFSKRREAGGKGDKEEGEAYHGQVCMYVGMEE